MSGVVHSILFNLVEELGALRSPIIDERLHVLLETVNRLLQLVVELLRFVQASSQIDERLIHLSVPDHDRVSLSVHALVLALFRPNPFILQETTVCRGELLQQRVLFVDRL